MVQSERQIKLLNSKGLQGGRRDGISPMAKFWTTIRSGQVFGRFGRNRLLSIRSVRILDSRVERGMPSRSAAPDDPNTRPPLARSASSITAFSWAASDPDNATDPAMAGLADSQL